MASLGSGSGGGGSSFSGNGGGTNGQPGVDPGQFPDFGQTGQFPDFSDEFTGMAIGVIIALICVLFVVALIVWIVSVIARGGLIAGVDTIESGAISSFYTSMECWLAASRLAAWYQPVCPPYLVWCWW